MKIGIYHKFKEYFWNSLKEISHTFSYLKVNNLGNGYVRCFWEIGPIDDLRIKLSKSCFYAIRLFDISNNRNIVYSTCIMKEIQVSKFQSSISFPIPVNKGVYYFEFGYRKRNGEWRKLAYQNINLGYRIKRVIQAFENDNWFDCKTRFVNNINYHEKAYKLSSNLSIGGSEELGYETDVI